MAPNMKANERLDDVAVKLKDAEAEADLAKKESKAARDRFNEVKRKRYAPSLMKETLLICIQN